MTDTDDTDRRIVDWQDDLEYGERWARLRAPAQRLALFVLWTACVFMFATRTAEATDCSYRAQVPATAPTARVETVYPPSAPVYETGPALDAGRTTAAVLTDALTPTADKAPTDRSNL